MVKINQENLPVWYQRLVPILEALDIVPGSPIAGSFALWLWQGHTTGKTPSWTPADIDIWFSSEVDMLRTAVNAFSGIQRGYPTAAFEKRGPAIVEIRVAEDLPTLQFIHRNTYGSERKAPYRFLDMFDLSVTQVAVEFFCHDTVQFAFGDDDVRSDIASGTCRCFRDMAAPDFAETNTPRLAKYKARGFEITQGVIRDLKWGSDYPSH